MNNSNLNQTGQNNSGGCHSGSVSKSNSAPKILKREYVAVTEGPELTRLENWIDEDLEKLLERNSNFETPSSRKKFFAR